MNNNLNKSKPLIFNKKVNNIHKTIPLNKRVVLLGPTKHYPSATREWNNNIYTYNSNSMKNLTVATNNVSALIRYYFDLHFSKNKKIRKILNISAKRLSLNKILFSKLNLKFTNEKVIISLFIYNQEKNYLIQELGSLVEDLFIKNNFNSLNLDLKKEKDFSIKDFCVTYSKLINNLSFIDYLKQLSLSINEELSNQRNNNFSNNLNNNKFLIENLELYLSEINNIINKDNNNIIYKGNSSYEEYLNIFRSILRFTIYRIAMKEIAMNLLILNINKNKFEGFSLNRLISLIRRVYNKKIELNFINLKNITLNSDMLTEAISLRMKNKKLYLSKILNLSLKMFKLPNISIYDERYHELIKKNLLVNKANNVYIKSILGNLKKTKDNLNQLLLKVFPNLSLNKNKDKDDYIQNIILSKLKYKNVGGLRLEAKGRLTRRATASRSLLKLRWKGSLKNVESSSRGWPSVILRGNLKTNLQYSIINSKTRNGAFGLKGWISSK